MATDPNFIQLTPEQINLLGEFAARTGRPREEVLADALRQYQPGSTPRSKNGTESLSLYDKLARKGLIGCLDGGPTDLSTNPKYMEGFGKD